MGKENTGEMGCNKTPASLPLIDFSKSGLNPGTAEWDLLKFQVLKALEEYGCFRALYNGIPSELRKSIFEEEEELFRLPTETKKLIVPERPTRGYRGPTPFSPLSQSMAIEDPSSSDKVERLTNTLWPQGKPSFSKTVQSMAKKLSELEMMVRRMILESLGVEKYLDEHINSSDYVLRLIKYESPQTTGTKIGLGTHSDKNIMTIICQNEVNGLEILSKDGDWICEKLSPDSFIVNVGDSFQGWTNGRLHSPSHRVTMTGNQARYSVVLSSAFKAGYIINVPEELVDEEHPLLFKPFQYYEFLKFCVNNKSNESAVKAYCGMAN